MSENKLTKNLANCNMMEFLAQTVRIRHVVETWLKAINLKNIRQRKPDLIPITIGMSESERLEAMTENQKRMKEQVIANMWALFDNIAGENPELTTKLLAMCCFVEDGHELDYTVSDYLGNVTDMISDQNVVNFFISLIQLGEKNTLTVSKQ